MSNKAKELKAELANCYKELERLQEESVGISMKITRIMGEMAAIAPIKWSYEIKRSLVDNNNKPTPVRILDILHRLKNKTGIEPDRGMKNKIVSTLSRMFNNGEIYKGDYGGHIYYGYPEVFETDKKTLKRKYTIILEED